MTTRKDTRAYGGQARDTFEKVGPGGQDVVDNASGAPSANTRRLPRDHAITPPPPARALRHRRPVMQPGEALGKETEDSAARAAKYLTVTETAARAGSGPLEQEYLDHVFGLNLPRRGRA